MKGDRVFEKQRQQVRRWIVGNDYDTAGRQVATYFGYDSNSSSSSGNHPLPVPGSSIIMEQQETTLDKAGNITVMINRQRYDDATGDGPLQDSSSQPKARVTIAASYPDALGRGVATVQYGVENPSSWTRSGTIPTGTDDRLVDTTAYNGSGEPYLTTDPMGAQVSRTWDHAGRVTEEMQIRVPGQTIPAIDRKTNYVYNSDGNVTQLKARNNTSGGNVEQVTTWTYGVTAGTNPGESRVTSNLLVAKKTYPDSTGSSDVVTYSYLRTGDVYTMTDQAGLVHTYGYDKLGRQTDDEVTSWGSSAADQTVHKLTTGYDVRGLVVAADSHGSGGTLKNSVTFQHNGWRQLTQESQTHTGLSARSFAYSYVSGATNTIRRTTMTTPGGAVQNFLYTATHADALSRVSSIYDGSTAIIGYKYLGLALPVEVSYLIPGTLMTLGTSTDAYAGLDRFGRPIDVQWIAGGSTVQVRAQYRYDRSSNRQWRYDAAAHAASVTSEDQWYEYDGLYQIRNFQRGALNGTFPNFSGITPVARNQAWNYDAMGNWSGLTNDTLNQVRQFNSVNEITSITGPSGVITPTYDPAGNMTVMPAVEDWTSSRTLLWDAWNRLIKVSNGGSTVAEYTYDALFRRATKTVSGTARHFYYNDQWQIIEEYVDSAANPHVRYWYGIRDINDIARRQRYSSGTTLQDDLYALRESMNVVALVGQVSSVWQVVQRMGYDAFGNSRFLTAAWASGTNAADWPVLFHAHYQDSETRLCQMRFRYYHPDLGVWLSRDPILENGGTHLYKYSRNNPEVFYDEAGLAATQHISKEECQAMIKNAASAGGDIVKIMADMNARKCPFDVVCKCCTGEDKNYGGFYEPTPKNYITICYNNIKDQNSFNTVIRHEAVHAWQYCRDKDIQNDCQTRLCIEIQAYTSDGGCASLHPENASAIQQCVVNKAAQSAARRCYGKDAKALAAALYSQCAKQPLTPVTPVTPVKPAPPVKPVRIK